MIKSSVLFYSSIYIYISTQIDLIYFFHSLSYIVSTNSRFLKVPTQLSQEQPSSKLRESVEVETKPTPTYGKFQTFLTQSFKSNVTQNSMPPQPKGVLLNQLSMCTKTVSPNLKESKEQPSQCSFLDLPRAKLTKVLL